ncbi:uncharacterized protein LOC142765885 [Rhipicephalus microplus]|uniref:uncharacterized protein LOC142765885 n=1 Tax=Rhipicephalus microplus TaxID=6941 RepID=UPI003F6C187B
MGLQAAELAERYLLKAGVLVDPKKDLLKGTLLPNSSRGTISEVVVRVPKKLLDRISEHSRTAIVFISLVVINKFNIRGKPSAPMNFTITLPPSTVRGPDFHKPAGSPSCGPVASLWTVLFATATVLAFVL